MSGNPFSPIRRLPAGMRMRQQRGVAMITALLLATLAVTIVASLFWQQQVQVRSIENQRLQLQKQWVLRGALDWARLILREDGKHSSISTLSDPWATPLAETRLDQYVEDGITEKEQNAAVLSGRIIDAQSRYNLSNLVKDGEIDPVELHRFARLLDILHLDSGLAPAIAKAFAAATKPDAAATIVPLPWQDISDLLAVPGVSAAMVDGLRDFVTVLPLATPINVNTASAEVLAARLDGLTPAQANALTEARAERSYSSIDDFIQRLNTLNPTLVVSGSLAVGTSYFLVQGNVRMGRAALASWSLIQRSGTGSSIAANVLWSREL